MDDSNSYRIRRCQHCRGTGVIEIGGTGDFKSTDKMSEAHLSAIVKNAVRSDPPEATWLKAHLERETRAQRLLAFVLTFIFTLAAAWVLFR